jgi:hypothetical protein
MPQRCWYCKKLVIYGNFGEKAHQPLEAETRLNNI